MRLRFIDSNNFWQGHFRDGRAMMSLYEERDFDDSVGESLLDDYPLAFEIINEDGTIKKVSSMTTVENIKPEKFVVPEFTENKMFKHWMAEKKLGTSIGTSKTSILSTDKKH